MPPSASCVRALNHDAFLDTRRGYFRVSCARHFRLAGVDLERRCHTNDPKPQRPDRRLVGVAVPLLAMGRIATTSLFALMSFMTLREFVSLTPTRRGDRLAMFLAFFVAIPFQYALTGAGWYGLFAVMLPVYGFFLLAAVSTFDGDTQHFLERVAKIQWAVIVCVYGVSHAPALLFLDIPGYDSGSGALLLYYLLIVQMSDVLQYVCGKLFGRHKVAPVLSPNKTWEGLLGGGALATALGAALHPFTPYSMEQAALMALAVVVTGFFGGLVLSAVKRSLGAKDWGYSIPGHGACSTAWTRWRSRPPSSFT
nr:phosphatidate cytidylyltransferase [Ramlibacter aurantiacus]